MIKNKYWESMITIVISVFILSFLLLTIASIIAQSSSVSEEYKTEKNINILKSNAYNIINKLNTKDFSQGEKLYIFKDNNEFKVFSWTINEKYKYIDKYWNYVDNISENNWNIYTRTLKLERKDIIKNKVNNFITIEVKKFNN